MIKRILEEEIQESSEEQNGFRAGRSCVDVNFILKTLIEKRIGRGRTEHLTFIDLQKAYDTIPLGKLWSSMKSQGINKAYIDAVKKLYEECTSDAKLGKEISMDFKVTKRLRQGCSLAPTLFKIYLETALYSWRRKCTYMGIRVGDNPLNTILFADDQFVIAEDEDDSSYMIGKLKEEYNKWGLEINLEKTEYLVIGEQRDLVLENNKIGNCSDFRYLGFTIAETGKSDSDIKKQNKTR